MLKINKINIRYWEYFLTKDIICHKILLGLLTTFPTLLFAIWTLPFSIFSLTGTIQPAVEVTIKLQVTILLFALYFLAFCTLLIIYTKKYKNTDNLTKEELNKFNEYFNIPKPKPVLKHDGWHVPEP